MSAGPAAFTYDLNGNLTGDGSVTFTYDVENRLVEAGGARDATVIYDPLGRLWEVAGTSTLTRFLYDGDALVAEYNASDTITERYVHGANAKADDPIVWYTTGTVSAATRRHLMANWQGSPALIADSSGDVINVNAWDAYGIPDAGNLGRFSYTGQIFLPEIGVYYYKARMYSPTLGRFLQTDPIGYEDQFNLYAYVANDPVNSVDPTGTTCQKAGKRYICKVDNVDRDKLSRTQRRQLANFERQYTRVVNRLMRLPNKQISVGPTSKNGDGKPLGEFKITRREAAQNLVGRKFSYKPGDTRGGKTARAYTTGGYDPLGRGRSPVVTHIQDRGLKDAATSTIIHDGALHGSRQEYSGGLATPGRSLLGNPPYRDGHQAPYTQASCELIDEC